MKLLALPAVCLLLCGFTWDWTVEFFTTTLFPAEKAVSFDMVRDFPALVDPDDLQFYLNEPVMAEQIVQGVQANLSADIYSGIGLPDMRQEDPGKRIIRIILDRIFR